MTVFNQHNTGHVTGYPLFLGQDLGIIDTINVQYPKLEELYQLQLSQIWNEFEVDLTQDSMDMLRVPEGTKDLMVRTLLYQTAADSIAARSIIESLGKYITNSECLNMATIWSFYEVIHARTYSHIIKQTFTEPNQLIEKIYSDYAILDRLKTVKDCFNNLENLSDSASDLEKRCAIINTLTALFGLEAITFLSSFAVTFAITETGVFQGIGQLVKLICRDEVLHTRMSYELFNIIKTDPVWKEALELTKVSRKEILDATVMQEIDSSEQMFQEGRKVVGLNKNLLQSYTMYMAAPIYKLHGLDFDLELLVEVPKTNPLPYMDSYIDSSSTQVAAQEIQLSSYNIGTISDDDLDNLDLNNL
jgi:ribonucleoside-diphosphate reductase beta chain